MQDHVVDQHGQHPARDLDIEIVSCLPHALQMVGLLGTTAASLVEKGLRRQPRRSRRRSRPERLGEDSDRQADLRNAWRWNVQTHIARAQTGVSLTSSSVGGSQIVSI